MNISCQELVELITDYFEDALDEPIKAEIEAHLDLCPHCAVYLEQMRRTIDLLGHVPVESLGEQAQRDLLGSFREYRPSSGG
jgi:anti-sigma factor RsiW